MRTLLFLLCIGFWNIAGAGPLEDCSGTPTDAITNLPHPLSRWGKIVCTPYGHIIASKEGWVWTNPGSYSPVFIPSQMVRDYPAELGNKSYFTQIAITPVKGKEFEEAYAAVNAGFDKGSKLPAGYRLEVKSVSGKSLKLYLFEYNNYGWGIWCTTACDGGSRFMLLDMAERPRK